MFFFSARRIASFSIGGTLLLIESNLKSQLSGFAQIDPFGWNAVGAKKFCGLTFWKFFGAFTALAHIPIDITFRTFINRSFESILLLIAYTFHECWSTVFIHEWMHTGRWTNWIFRNHDLIEEKTKKQIAY